MPKSKSNDPWATTFHRDYTVTVWNVYTQTWQRMANPSDEVLASISRPERDKIVAHCKKGRF